MIQSNCLSAAMCLAIALSSGTGSSLAADKPFTHPGILHSRAELDFVKSKVAAGDAPWKAAWEGLRGDAISKLDWKPKPAANVVRGPYNNPDIGGTDLMRDAAGAYAHAIQWYVTDEKRHADKAIAILDAYAIIKDFYPAANGNWDAAMIQAMLAMGVFLDDRDMFQRAEDYYLNGQGNGAIRHYINDFGECQESGRDQAHTQMGLGYLGCAAEIAWKQGVDLYGAYDNRLALGFEYTAKYNLGHDVRYEPYRSHAGNNYYPAISDNARGRFSSIYERVCHHYHDRMGLEMPFTGQVVEKNRPEGWQTPFASWGTLMHAGLPVAEKEDPGKS